jgi:hypothetical protein
MSQHVVTSEVGMAKSLLRSESSDWGEAKNHSGLKQRSCHMRADGSAAPHWLTADDEIPKI